MYSYLLPSPRLTMTVSALALALTATVLGPVQSQAVSSRRERIEQLSTATMVKREHRTIVIRGGTANSSFNFGTGLFANGVTDYNGRLVAGKNCEQSDRHNVSCGPSSAWNRVRGSMGGGNDEIGAIVPMHFVGVAGGPGRDTFYGLSGRDRFLGGGGKDTLIGYFGDDYLSGGPGADLIRCGPGRDVANIDRRDRVFGCEVKR